MKTCRDCKEEIPLTEFYPGPRGVGHRPACKECNRASNRAWHRANPERSKLQRDTWRAANPKYWRANRLLKDYGITTARYNEMADAQHGGCAICGLSCSVNEFLSVDHDHKTGKVRGLLCNDCNTSLGKFKDNTALLERAIGYLERSA